MILTPKYQDYFAGLALSAARGSLDPSTKVGAVIYRPDRTTASTGFNGLPRGIPDTAENLNDRSRKYPRMVHAEANALDHKRECVAGYGMVVTAPPCAACTLKIISNGIKTVYHLPASDYLKERWAEDFALSEELFAEANISVFELDKNKGRD